jgi:hypothetical protein
MGINVDSKTFNMVGGGGINSPTHQTSRYQGFLRMGTPDSPVRHRGANGASLLRQRSNPTASSDS